MLHQALVFGSMLTAGVALFTTAAVIQADRTAFTSSRPREVPPLVTRVSALTSEKVEERVEEAAPMMMLPPVEIVARKHVLRRRAAQMSNTPVMVAAPCSDWQDLGPQRVEEGTGIGTHRVRALCFGPAATSPLDE